MKSHVAAISAADPAVARRHFELKLSLETDCADVHAALSAGEADFVLLDVRSEALFAKSHIPGAISVPHATIDAERVAGWPEHTLFVVYCAGPHCNGGDRGAARLAALGRRVKLMIGGMTGWADEGFSFASGSEEAPAPIAAAG